MKGILLVREAYHFCQLLTKVYTISCFRS